MKQGGNELYRDNDMVWYNGSPKEEKEDWGFLILIIGGLAILFIVLLLLAHPPNAEVTDSDVFEELDKKGGVIYLSETTGSGSLSLVDWYVPVESDVNVSGDYVHINKAKSYYYDSNNYNLYIPKNAILSITVY